MDIGGLFEYPEYYEVKPENTVFQQLHNCYGKKSHTVQFIRDGRQAIKACLLMPDVQKKTRKYYLPSYLCSSVLQPFVELDLLVHFYSHNYPLKPEIDFTIKNSLILIIDTFGVPFISNKELLELSNNNNIVVLDISHSIFNRRRFELKSDKIMLISSLRKIFPIPDGGVVFHTKTGNLFNLARSENYESMLESMYLKKYYLKMGAKKKDQNLKKYYLDIYKKYIASKTSASDSIQEIPEISLDILRNLSLREIYSRRATNLNYILNNVDKYFHFIDLKAIKSPFFAPILCADNRIREKIKNALIELNVYPPIHWELPREVPRIFDFEYDLSERILSIPIDQRYTPTDLRQIPDIINSHILK